MKQRIITASVFTLIMLFCFFVLYWQPSSSLILALLICVLCLKELRQLLQGKTWAQPRRYYEGQAFLFLGALPLFCFQQGSTAWDKTLLIILVLFLGSQLLALLFSLLAKSAVLGCQNLPELVLLWALSFYLSSALFALLALAAWGTTGFWALILAFTSPWLSDSIAYLWGSAFGKSKLVPLISPAKTWAGSGAALLGTALVFALLAYWGLDRLCATAFLPWQRIVLGSFLGLLYSLQAQVGDLFESLLKRYLNVKDSGKLLPGHGGIWDRFDSALACLPLSFILVVLLSWLA